VAEEDPVKVRILDVIKVRGRDGQLALFQWAGGPEPKTGDVYLRVSDGSEWNVRGVESRLIPLRPGHPVGLLLRPAAVDDSAAGPPKEIAINDELEKKS
jgi:hypothetical protein